jgi:hypothetical protein
MSSPISAMMTAAARVAQPGHRPQEVDGCAKGREDFAEPRLHLRHRGLEGFNLCQVQREHEPMVRRDAPAQHLGQLRGGGFQSPCRQFGQSFGIGFAVDDGAQDRATAGPEDVIGGAAGWLPAWRASRIDPAEVLLEA